MRPFLAITILLAAIIAGPIGALADGSSGDGDKRLRIAVINPAAIRQSAAEDLVIEILGVSIEEFSEPLPGLRSIHLLAEVLSVTRTRSDLVKGNVILIAWQQRMAAPADSDNESNAMHEPGWAGPAEFNDPGPLPVGTIARAWLEIYGDGSSGLVYGPSARELSFEQMQK